MTTTVVKTIGASGSDYTTIAAWEAASPADLTSADQIWQGQLKSENFSNSGNNVVTFAGVTTDTTRYLELKCQSGASFSDNASVQTNALRYNTSNGASISATNNYSFNATVITDTTANVRLTGLQISAAGSNAVVGALAPIIDRCIMEGSSTAKLVVLPSGGTIKNSLLVQRGASPGAFVDLPQGGSVYNCTMAATVGTPSIALDGNYSTHIYKNCAIFGATAIKTGGATPTYTTCVTNISSPPTGFTGSIAYSTSTGAKFQNITDGTHDFRIKTASSLIDVGTTDSTNAAIDIAGTARPSGASYDVGAWEFVSSGGGGRLFRTSPGGNLSGLGSSGPFFQNPLQ